MSAMKCEYHIKGQVCDEPATHFEPATWSREAHNFCIEHAKAKWHPKGARILPLDDPEEVTT